MTRFCKNFKRRAKRVHYKVRCKSFEKPRLSVFRSERHIYAQIVDDSCGRVLCSISTIAKDFEEIEKTSNCNAAAKVGVMIAKKAVEAGIKEVVFDRGGYRFHGRIKALADSARNGGLLF